jgi:hypothetical protein
MDVAGPPESIATLCQLDGRPNCPSVVSPDLSAKLLGRWFKSDVWSGGSHVAQCGSWSSTGQRNFSPWGPHSTSGLSKVSPAHQNHNVCIRSEVLMLVTVKFTSFGIWHHVICRYLGPFWRKCPHHHHRRLSQRRQEVPPKCLHTTQCHISEDSNHHGDFYPRFMKTLMFPYHHNYRCVCVHMCCPIKAVGPIKQSSPKLAWKPTLWVPFCLSNSKFSSNTQ